MILKYPQILALAISLSSLSVFAQLYVRNDNFVFVNDQIIYVEDNIGLQEADSKLYLREEAQLIQGVGTTGNSGLGQLSIFQSGTTHQYAYNYWCSPVGNNSLVLGNEAFRVELLDESTGLITSQDVMFTTDFDGFVQDLSSNPTDLTISSEWLYTFDSSEVYAQWIYQGETGDIGTGLGFTMKGIRGASNNQLYDFRGKANNGTITNSVDEYIWTLVGNPYPSAVDALEYIHDTDNVAAINGVLYYWEQDLSVFSHVLADYVGGYALYTISSDGLLETYIHAPFNTYDSSGVLNVAGSPRTSGKNLGRYIPVAQGFMVQGIGGTSGTVRMKNSHRVYEKESPTNGQFFRNSSNNSSPEDTFKSVPNDYKRFRINIDFDDIYTRQLVQTFHDSNTTEDFDYGYDIPHHFSLAHDAYWMSTDNSTYTAQAQPLDVETTVLPLDMYLSEAYTVRFRIADVQNFDSDQAIFWHDKHTDQYINLREQDVDITLDANYYGSRFEIVFTEKNSLSTDDDLLNSFDVRHYLEDKQLSIYNYNNAIKNVSIYDMLGKRVMSFDDLGTQQEHTIDTSFLSAGPYVVKIQSEDDNIISKKIIAK